MRGKGGGAGGGAPRSATGSADAFPWIVTLTALVLGILLFLHSTVPALDQGRELRAVEREHQRAAEHLESGVGGLRRRREALPDDPELVLIELDAQGVLPEQAVDIHAGENRSSARSEPGR